MMEKLVKITKSQKSILDNLLQIYLHDISLYFPIDFNSVKGRYEYDDISKYFKNSENQAYFLVDDDNIVGFTLIDKIDDSHVIQEFFIMNNYKRKGLGKKFVFKIFDSISSHWIIKVLPKSPVAEQFWKKTIKEYTNNKFNKLYIGRFNRAVYEFNN